MTGQPRWVRAWPRRPASTATTSERDAERAGTQAATTAAAAPSATAATVDASPSTMGRAWSPG